MEIKTTPNSVYLPSENPRGVFIATSKEGGQGTRTDPKRRTRRHSMAAEMRQKPRFRGCP